MPEHGSDEQPAKKAEKKSPRRKRSRKGEKNRKSEKKGVRKSAPPDHRKPPRLHRPRASAAEIANRVGVIARLILEGSARPRHIRRALAEMFGAGEVDWYVPDGPTDPNQPLDLRAVPWRTVERYIQIANLELAAIADEQRSAAKGKARGRYELALAGAFEAKQWDTVRKINRDLVRLDGLEPGQRVHVDGSITNTHTGNVEHTVRPVGGSLEERAAAVANLFGLAAARRTAAARAQEVAASN